MSSRKFVIKQETRDRCQIESIDSVEFRKKFRILTMELFHYFYEAGSIAFPLFIRVESETILFMRPEEYSAELLDSIRAALGRNFDDVDFCILREHVPQYEQMLGRLRGQKIDALMVKDPYLDRNTLELFSDLSGASQMVVRGGLTPGVHERVTESAHKLVDALFHSEVAISTLSRMVTVDPTLYDHSASVAMIAGVIGGRLIKNPLPKEMTEMLARCGLYHDVGKTCVPNHILNKPGKFTPEEFEVMKTHTTLGYEELQQAINEGAPIEDIVARVALEHHERFLGQGYPHGKKGRAEDDEESGIHLFTRIVTVADVYSALLMKRVYKPAFEASRAIKIMADTHTEDYDPDVFLPFLRNVVEGLNYYTEKDQEDKKDSGRLLIIEDGKLKVSS